MTIDARHPLPGTRPLVVGAGRAGVAAARLLAGLGLDVRVCDAAGEAERSEAVRALFSLDLHLGSEGPELLGGRDFVVWTHEDLAAGGALVEAARGRGLPVLSDLELGFLAAPATSGRVPGSGCRASIVTGA